MNPYETDKLLSEYLLFHYGEPEEVLPWPDGPWNALDFPVRCVRECIDATRLPPVARALDAGCAVGRSSFELARYCAEVIGVDFSQRFIEAAGTLARDGSLAYLRTEEGALATPLVARVPGAISRSRVRFEHGDAHALDGSLGVFDVVLAANLIDRLAEPARFLEQLPRLVAPRGQLVITSPYTWIPEYTSPEQWLGGYTVDGEPRMTLDSLGDALEGLFRLVAARDMPFLIREHSRKYQWSVAQATIWRRE
jgi:putative 4-mercaptohistidine N1-methyltranferase